VAGAIARFEPDSGRLGGGLKQPLHFTDLFADSLELQREFLIQAGDAFGD
jgi:hypothetical protein